MICIAVLNNLIVNGSARFLNKLYANDVDIGSDVVISGKTTTGQLVINGGTNVGTLSTTNSSTGNIPVVIGSPTGRHIAIDADEIAGKGSATTAGNLWLNYGGGTVYLSTGQQIYATNGTFTTPNLKVTNIGDNNNYVSTAYVTNANITTINSSTISNSGKITANDMEVMDTLKSYKWDISHVANLANDFTVSPTLQLASGATIQFTAINTTTGVCTFTVTDSSSISSDSLGGVTWSQYSKVKFTMNLNNVINSNCNGYLTAKMNSTAGTMTISGTLDNVTGLATGTAYNAEGATIMLYEVGAGNQSTTYPVGIRMTAYGSNKRSYIDIYGGTATSSWTTPHVRIGNVGGLTFNGSTLENQWGIYTDMGYFSGAIVSTEGKIGGFDIGQTNIRNAVTSLTDSSHTGIYLGTDGIRNYNTTGSKHVTIKDGTITANSVDLTGTITATTGSIGGWTINASSISSNNSTSIKTIVAGTRTASSTGNGVYMGSNGVLNIGKESDNYLIFNGTNLDLKTDWLRFNSTENSVIIGGHNKAGAYLDPDTFNVTNEDGVKFFSLDMDGEMQNIAYNIGKYETDISDFAGYSYQWTITIKDSIASELDTGSTFEVRFIEKGSEESNGVTYSDRAYFIKGTAKNTTLSIGGETFTANYNGDKTFVFEGYVQSTEFVDWIFIIRKQVTLPTPSYTIGTRIDEAKGSFSATIGEGLSASHANQIVIGKYNEDSSNAAFIIGNGSSNALSNALTVDWNGVVSCGGISTSGTITAANHQMGIVEAMAKTTTNANSGGVTAYWYYRKWSNNLVECWTTSSVSIAPTAANTKANRRITLPVTIPTKYSMQATIRGIPEIATCHIGLENINDNEIRLYIYESNTTARSVDIYVIGSQ